MVPDGATSHSEEAVQVSGDEREPSPARCTGWDNGACEGTSYCPPRCPRFFDAAGCPLLCRRYQETDLRSMVEMYEGLESSTLGLPPNTRTGIEQWLGDLIDGGSNLVCVDDERVIGHLGIVPTDVREAEIVVFVDGAYQNRGIGTELVTQAIAHASTEDYDALTLMVNKGNCAAITVYRNVGFRVDQYMVGELEMRLALDEPVAAATRHSPVDRK